MLKQQEATDVKSNLNGLTITVYITSSFDYRNK